MKSNVDIHTATYTHTETHAVTTVSPCMHSFIHSFIHFKALIVCKIELENGAKAWAFGSSHYICVPVKSVESYLSRAR